MQLNTKRFLFLSASACALLMVVLSVTASCNKKLSSYNPDFVGTWRTATITDTVINEIVRSEIVIQKNDGIYNNTCKDTCGERLCDCVSQQSGKAVINSTKDMIRIGSSSASYPLSIDKEPYQGNNGQWMMIIDGLTYYKE